MKRFGLVALLVLLTVPAPLAAGEETAETHLAIQGMTCGGCVAAVRLQLGRTEGVTAYDVSLEDAEASVTYDPARTTPAAIAASVSKTGFEATVRDPEAESDQATTSRAAPVRQCAGGTCRRDCCRSARVTGTPAVAGEAADLVSLAGGISRLASDFDAAKGRSRFVAILSPTCSACVHGAEAIAEAILPGGSEVDVFVVWAPMLDGDDDDAASGRSAILRAPHVRQYWDPERRVGAAFRQDVFPDAVSRMGHSLPEGHYFHPYLAERDASQPEWDIYMLFSPEAEWTEETPPPSRWVRQTALLDGGEQALSLLWVDDYSRPPREGSLVEELKQLARGPGERVTAR